MPSPTRNDVPRAGLPRAGQTIARKFVSAALIVCLLVAEGVAAAPSEQVKIGPGATIVKLRSLLGQRDDASGVQVEGIERTGTVPDGRLDAHVLYVHGMGSVGAVPRHHVRRLCCGTRRTADCA